MRMKAAFFEGPGRPFVFRDVPLPHVGKKDVLVKVEACGICHTDYSVFSGRYKPRTEPPYIMGHEIVGTVEACGEDASSLSVGTRVLVSPIESCGECRFCRSGLDNLCENRKVLGMDRNGGFAEYVAVPEKNLIPVNDRYAPEQWSLLVDAVSTGYHAIRANAPKENDTVVVFGLGGLGFSAVLILRQLYSCRVIGVDVTPERLAGAASVGVETVLSKTPEETVAEIRKMTGGSGADLVFEFVGRPETYQAAALCARCGGQVVFIGAGDFSLQIPAAKLYRDEVRYTGAYSTTFADLCACVEDVKTGRLRLDALEIVTLPAEEINRGMKMFEQPNRTWNRVVTLWK